MQVAFGSYKYLHPTLWLIATQERDTQSDTHKEQNYANTYIMILETNIFSRLPVKNLSKRHLDFGLVRP